MSELNHFYLTLVRHGESSANRLKVLQGQTDSRLSDTGVKQAQQLSQHMDCNGFDLIFSSDLSRALDTTKIIVGCDERIQTDVRLRERCFGDLEDKPYEEVFKELKVSVESFKQFTPNGGESQLDVRARVLHFFGSHLIGLMSNESNVLIVSHGGVIREIIAYMKEDLKCQFNGLSDEQLSGLPFNTGVTKFKVFYMRREMVSAECLLLNDIQHLSGDCKATALLGDR